MATDWTSLPVLRNDRLIFENTGGAPMPNGVYPCLLCTKPFLMGVFIGTPDQICPECQKTYADAAKVICNGKGGLTGKPTHSPITICRLVPKTLDNGFHIRPRAVLHVNACNTCRPGIKESEILEISEWEKHQRRGKIISQRK